MPGSAHARGCAQAALERYPLRPLRLRPLSEEFNSTFRLDAAEGRFVVRVGRPGWREPRDIVSTAAWMRALARETDLLVPDVVRTTDGADYATVEDAEALRHCVVETWVPGPIVGERCSARFMRMLGDATARLHLHADGFAPPDGFTTRIVEESWVASAERIAEGLPWSIRGRALVEAGKELADTALSQLVGADPTGRRFLHVDLHRWNLKYAGDRIGVIDFDDSSWAYPQQDIGIAFFHVIDRPDRDALWEAFQRGYEARRPWPERVEGEVRRFTLARGVDLASFVLEHRVLEEEDLAGWLARMETRFALLLDPGAA